jgi:hypothetical protein
MKTMLITLLLLSLGLTGCVIAPGPGYAGPGYVGPAYVGPAYVGPGYAGRGYYAGGREGFYGEHGYYR